MPQGDPNAQPPESIVLQQWDGIKNTVTPERLQLSELEAAVNVDLDDVGQPHRRRGYTLKAAGDFHSVTNVGGRVLGVKNGELGVIHPDYSFAALATAGNDPVSFVQVAATTYFSSASVSGKIQQDVVSAWGATDDAGEWVSPVLTPTDTLGAIGGKFISAPPLATKIEWYRGRIYLAAGPVLWVTELWQYDYVEKTRNFYYFEDDITMLRAMDDGLFIGTETQTYFLKGVFSEGHERSIVLDAGVVRGSEVMAARSQVHPNARNAPMAEGGAVIFLTSAGVCAGFDGGEVFNLTHGRVAFPNASNAAALYRDDLGVTSYVVTADSAGGPSANARIGDFADAEIRRAV